MPIKRALATAAATFVLALTVLQPSAEAVTQPPPTGGCWVVAFPSIAQASVIRTCDGSITWGAQHGVARVHATVSVTPPRVSPGMTVTYLWRIGTTSFYGRYYYTFPWATKGKPAGVIVTVRTAHGTFHKAYYFGVVRPPL